MTKTRAAAALIAAAALSAVEPVARAQSGDQAVTLSAVVVDKAGLPVRDLTANDFRITENSTSVAITRAQAVTTATTATRGRSIVLVLGSAGTDPALTMRVQKLANGFFETAAPNDLVSVIRVATRNDEVAGARGDMLMRIAEFRAPMGEPFHAKTSHDVLDRVANISKELLDFDTPRRALVFIGAARIFDVLEPQLRENELVWPHWVSALTEAARANLSVYVIDPNGLSPAGRVRINPDGLVAQTGGFVLDNSNGLEAARDRVWRETSSYYELEYVPATSRREIQDIKVTVARPGVSLRARRSR